MVLKASFFETCDRDDEGRCKPGPGGEEKPAEQGGSGKGPEASSLDRSREGKKPLPTSLLELQRASIEARNKRTLWINKFKTQSKKQGGVFIGFDADELGEAMMEGDTKKVERLLEKNQLPKELTDEALQDFGSILPARNEYYRRLNKLGDKKEAWEITKDESETPVTYSDMGYVVGEGDERVFYRLGAPPPGGRSYNTMTQTREIGVSVYVTPTAGSLAGIVDRPVYYGKGKVIGFGGDDEPLVTITDKWIKYPGHKKIVAQAVSEGKPVPEDVLRDYPRLRGPKTRLSGTAKKPPSSEKSFGLVCNLSPSEEHYRSGDLWSNLLVAREK